MNFKIMIFSDGKFGRWEELPYGVNRSYKIRYDKVLLEGREGVATQKEIVLVEAMSSKNLDEPTSLASLQVIKRIDVLKKKSPIDKNFDPFKMAESDEVYILLLLLNFCHL